MPGPLFKQLYFKVNQRSQDFLLTLSGISTGVQNKHHFLKEKKYIPLYAITLKDISFLKCFPQSFKFKSFSFEMPINRDCAFFIGSLVWLCQILFVSGFAPSPTSLSLTSRNPASIAEVAAGLCNQFTLYLHCISQSISQPVRLKRQD